MAYWCHAEASFKHPIDWISFPDWWTPQSPPENSVYHNQGRIRKQFRYLPHGRMFSTHLFLWKQGISGNFWSFGKIIHERWMATYFPFRYQFAMVARDNRISGYQSTLPSFEDIGSNGAGLFNGLFLQQSSEKNNDLRSTSSSNWWSSANVLTGDCAWLHSTLHIHVETENRYNRMNKISNT